MKLLLGSFLPTALGGAGDCFTDVNVASQAYLGFEKSAGVICTACTGGTFAWTSNTVALTKSGDDWDPTATANYALGADTVSTNNANTDACTVGDGNIYFHGEKVDSSSASTAYCTDYTRSTFPSALIVVADKLKAKLTSLTNAGDICDNSGADPARIDATAVTRLNHNQDGDATKPCLNVPLVTIGKSTCTATQVCDWFKEDANPCVTKTEVITDQWTAASATVNWCMPGNGEANQASSWAHRRTATGDAASGACQTGEFCNWGRRGTEPLCIAANLMLGATKALQARATGDGTKYCLSKVGAKICTTLETCDPNATARASICLTTLDGTANASIIMAHGQTGDDAKTYLKCINDGKAIGSCTKTQVCNQKAGTNSGDACIAHTALIGDFTAGGDWTAAKQVRGEPTTAKTMCMSSGAGAKACVVTPAADLEICNPNATALADLCVKKSTTLNHNQEFVAADTTATPNVPAKEKCVAKTNMATCKKEELCNQGTGTNTCINKTEVLVNRAPGDGKKFCFGTDAAEVCTKDTHLCNVNGKEGGKDAEAICVAKDTVVEHLKEAKDPLIVCIGDTGSSKHDKDDETKKDLVICDNGTGEFGKKADKMAPGALQLGTDKPADCYGTSKKQVCPKDYYCNPTGTDITECATGKDADPVCSVSHVCIKNTSVIADAQSTWVKDGTDICMASETVEEEAAADENGDAAGEAKKSPNKAWDEGTPLELCTETKQYCALDTGVCSAEAPTDSAGEDGTTGDKTGDASDGSTVGITASVLAMLSTL